MKTKLNNIISIEIYNLLEYKQNNGKKIHVKRCQKITENTCKMLAKKWHWLNAETDWSLTNYPMKSTRIHTKLYG